VDAGEAAAVVVAVASAIAVCALVVAVVSMTRAVADLRRTTEELRRDALPAVAELRETVGTASVELERVESLIDTAETVTNTVDSASRLAYVALSNPVIKAMSIASGTGRAARRLRRARGG
jgi:hypothetical protein